MIHEYSRTELLVEKEGLQRLKDATLWCLEWEESDRTALRRWREAELGD